MLIPVKGLERDLEHSSAQQVLATMYEEKENGCLPLHGQNSMIL